MKKTTKIVCLFALNLFMALSAVAMNDDVKEDDFAKLKPEDNPAAAEALAQVRKRHRVGIRNEALSSFGKAGLAACASYVASGYLPAGVIPMAGMGMVYMAKEKAVEFAAYCGLAEQTESLRRASKLNTLEEQFEVRKNFFLEFNRNELSRLIADARHTVGYGLKQAYGHDNRFIQGLFSKIENILKLPTRPSKPLAGEHLDAALSALHSHLLTYSNYVHDEIITAAIKINNLTAAYRSQDAHQPAKASFWFVGEAGVGKTETAAVLAKSLKRPFCKLNLGAIPLENLLGMGSTDELGVLAKCFITPDSGEPALDPIIFIDEVHDVLNGDDESARKLYMLLKLITEGGETEISENSLGAKIDLSRVIFILASNSRVQKDAAGALATRVKDISFDSLTKNQKKTIAEQHFKRLSEVHGYMGNQNDNMVLSDIVALDNSPGARVLINVIEEYIIHQQACGLRALRCVKFDIVKTIEKFGGKVNPSL